MGKSIGVIGFPSVYGGAGVELDHQITLWHRMGLDIHIVPSMNVVNETLLNSTLFRAKIYNVGEYDKLKGMPVISFCNDVFLRDIEKIKKYASQTIFVNCMTWLFSAEKESHKKGLIDLFLYQSRLTQKKVNSELLKINKNYKWKIFNSYFDDTKFPYHKNRTNDKFRFGRISREDGDKYSGDTLWVYETMVAPVTKSGIILGYNKEKTEKKIGIPSDWIRTYPGNGITQQEFYAHCSCIIQKADTFENWPRVAMEAMSSGAILIVDNRGGWTKMVKHGKTGWLCNDSRDFVYYSSRMAYEVEEREQMALNAKDYLKELCGEESSIQSWKEIFNV